MACLLPAGEKNSDAQDSQFNLFKNQPSRSGSKSIKSKTSRGDSHE
jgi:hypothetical protein